jgi:glycosyltransferase 2 family protein
VTGDRTAPRSAPNQFGRFALKLAFGVAVLGLVAWLVDLGQTFRTLRGIDAGWLALAVLAYLATRVLVGIKWWVLLGGQDAAVSYPTVQRAMLLSDFHGLLFPNTLAVDALRAVLLRHHPRGLTFTAASIVADRVINLAVAAGITLLALASAWLLHKSGLAPRVAIPVAGVAGTVLVATLALASQRLFATIMRLLGSVAARGSVAAVVERVLQRTGEMHAAMRTMLTDPRIMRRAVLLAILLVLVRGLWTYFLFLAVGVAVSPLWIVTLMPVITIIALLPVTVLGLGLKDGAFVFFFAGIGVAAHAALAVSLASYAVIIAANLVLGLLATVFGPPLPQAETSRSG